jgi:hypothetical protein
MRSKGCHLRVRCDDCCDKSKSTMGYYSPSAGANRGAGVITLCRRRNSDYAQTLLHEVSHQFDYCLGADIGCGRENWAAMVCTELRAYRFVDRQAKKEDIVSRACSSFMSTCFGRRLISPGMRESMEDLCHVAGDAMYESCTGLGTLTPLPPLEQLLPVDPPYTPPVTPEPVLDPILPLPDPLTPIDMPNP